MDHYVLAADGKTPVAVDMLTWAAWFECRQEGGPWVIGKTAVGDVEVSTVFLGLNHRHSGERPAILWETMVFGGSLDGEGQRYATHAEAQAGHAAMVERVRVALETSDGTTP